MLPSVFETYVEHQSMPPTRETGGGHGSWRAVASLSDEILPDTGIIINACNRWWIFINSNTIK